jgi:anti-sigma regulatory factor (Ser/Thr protein kinase)
MGVVHHAELRLERGFRHEALLYAGADGFLAATVPWLREAAGADEPVLVVVSAAKIDRLRAALGADAGKISFADMAEVGANPARIIPAWRAFVDEHAGSGRRLRGIGEPVSPEREAAELVECQRHEALLNLAFEGGAEDFWLLCPYDTEALDPAVVEQAHHSHPVLMDRGASRRSAAFAGLEAIEAPFAAPLPAPPPDADEIPFAPGTLAALRSFVSDRATAAGLAPLKVWDLVLAVNELATNSVRHAGGMGVLRLWQDERAVVCEVADSGRIADPLAGRRRPAQGQPGGHGLWLCNQICDLVQVRSLARGSVVRLHLRVA